MSRLALPRSRDVTRLDLLWSVGVALGIELGMVAVASWAYARRASAPLVDPGFGVPVELVPVAEAPPGLLKLGGGRSKILLPRAWRRQPSRVVRADPQPPKPAPTPQTVAPAPEAQRDAPIAADAGSADAGEEVDAGESVLSSETGDEAAPSDGGTIDAPEGEGSPEGVPDGTETDPAVARAVTLYRARLIRWLAVRFSVRGSGLSEDELTRLEVSATVRVDERRRVAGYRMQPSGNDHFDRAARQALENAVGLELPPPPPDYPGPVQREIHVTYVCTVATCD